MAPSPDLIQYIQLPLIDKDPQDVYENAILDLQSNFPEWIPREGQMEVLLLEALALQVAEAIFAINRLPDGISEVLLSLYGIERDNGQQPVADIRFEMSGTIGYTIPAGTQVRLNLDNGLEPIVFTTDSELIIDVDNSFGVVSATGDRYTSDANGTPVDTILEMMDSLVYVNYAKIDSPVTGGRPPENDIDYLNRGAQRFQRLSDTLVLPKHFEAAALEQDYVSRAHALDNYDPAGDPDDNGPVGNDAGHITVAVYGDNEFLSSDDKADLLALYEPGMLASLQVHLIDPVLTEIDVSATVAFDSDVDTGSVTEEIVLALQNYLNPMTWNWDAVVRRNQLISIITNIPGVNFVSSLTVPASDVTLSSVANLVTSGDIVITEL